MDFHKQYRSMNENITPSDALVQQTIAKMESGRPHRARKRREELDKCTVSMTMLPLFLQR